MSRVYREGGSMRIVSYHFYLELTTRNIRSWIPYIEKLYQLKSPKLPIKDHDSPNVPGVGGLCLHDSCQTSTSQTQLFLQSGLVLLGWTGRLLQRWMSVWFHDGSLWSSLSPGSWRPLWRSRGQLWSLWHWHEMSG